MPHDTRLNKVPSAAVTRARAGSLLGRWCTLRGWYFPGEKWSQWEERIRWIYEIDFGDKPTEGQVSWEEEERRVRGDMCLVFIESMMLTGTGDR